LEVTTIAVSPAFGADPPIKFPEIVLPPDTAPGIKLIGVSKVEALKFQKKWLLVIFHPLPVPVVPLTPADVKFLKLLPVMVIISLGLTAEPVELIYTAALLPPLSLKLLFIIVLLELPVELVLRILITPFTVLVYCVLKERFFKVLLEAPFSIRKTGTVVLVFVNVRLLPPEFNPSNT
jgi:hypothetical protein